MSSFSRQNEHRKVITKYHIKLYNWISQEYQSWICLRFNALHFMFPENLRHSIISDERCFVSVCPTKQFNPLYLLVRFLLTATYNLTDEEQKDKPCRIHEFRLVSHLAEKWRALTSWRLVELRPSQMPLFSLRSELIRRSTHKVRGIYTETHGLSCSDASLLCTELCGYAISQNSRIFPFPLPFVPLDDELKLWWPLW